MQRDCRQVAFISSMLAVCAFMNEAAFIYKPLQICLSDYILCCLPQGNLSNHPVNKTIHWKNLQLVTQRKKIKFSPSQLFLLFIYFSGHSEVVILFSL